MTEADDVDAQIVEECLPGLAELVTEAAKEAGMDITVDAAGLRKILAFAAGGRVHSESEPPQPGPSPVREKSLHVPPSPFRTHAKAIVKGKDKRGYNRCYDSDTGHPVPCGEKKPAGKGRGKKQAKVPTWADISGKYKNPGQWVEATFSTEEARDAARATPAYRQMVEEWADEKGRQWGEGDPRNAPDEAPTPKAPSGPGTPGWVDVPLTLVGDGADAHLAQVFTAAFVETTVPAGHAQSSADAAARMPRRARDLLADGLKDVKYAATKELVTEFVLNDVPDIIAAVMSRPNLAATEFRTAMKGRNFTPEYAEYEGALRRVADDPALESQLGGSGPKADAAKNIVSRFLTRLANVELELSRGVTGGVYTEVTGTAYLDGPISNSVVTWVTEAAVGMDEGRYRISTSDDAQTDVHAHELTHAIDRGGRFSKTPEWGAIWAEELGGDDGLMERLMRGKFPGKKYPLTVYAATKASEGFAEVGRVLYGGDTDLLEFQKRYPRTSAFFQANDLWPDGDFSGAKKDYPDVFIARLPFLGETSHADILASAWKEVKNIFRGRDKR